jgi:hypothetical protein
VPGLGRVASVLTVRRDGDRLAGPGGGGVAADRAGQLTGQVQGEGAALGQLAFRADLAAEQGADLAGDRQP